MGTITLRIDDVLVAIGADTDVAVALVRSRFSKWIDDTQPDIEPTFDLLLAATAGRGVRPVPQLRRGTSAIARSRSDDDVVAALDSVLGGILAQRADRDRTWTFLRPFVSDSRVVLVDARAPMLVNDPLLARAGIVEIPTWAVALAVSDGTGAHKILVPSALTENGGDRRYDLVGMVATGDGTSPGEVLARYGSRSTSPAWFGAVAALVDGDRFVTAPDRVAVREAIARLLRSS